MTELETALRHFADTYYAGVVGCEWEEACDMAETVANNFRWHGGRPEPMPDSAVASYLYGEAVRYQNM